MLDQVREAIRRYGLTSAGDHVLVAVSGGADSMALLYALFWLREEFGLTLSIAHLDHGIREDTAEDLRIVRAAAAELGLPLAYEKADVPRLAREQKLNLEEAARRVRREFLLRAKEEEGAQKIALGHTRTDLAETVLLHLLRGAGPGGMRGFLPKSLPFIRPLILASRQDARTFCQDHGIPFRDDLTNLDTRLRRNAVRLELLPQLSRYNPRIEESLARTAQLWAQAEEVLDWAGEQALGPALRGEGVDLAALRKLPPSLQALVVRELASRQGLTLYYPHVEAILRGVAKGNVAELALPQGFLARIGGGLLTITAPREPEPGPWPLPVPGAAKIPGWLITAAAVPRPADLNPGDKMVAYAGLEKVRTPVYVRVARREDEVILLGQGKSRRVWDILAKSRIPRWEREEWPVVCDQAGIVWVVGQRITEGHNVVGKSPEVLRFSASRT